MLFSVVVPVYNAEIYLKSTIESVIKQSFNDWQLVLVNDGSDDDSLTICNEYRNFDERIIVVSQENSGPSAARNTGINVAQGEYIMFLDSDDEYQPNAFENVAKLLHEKNIDLVMSSAEVVNVDKGKTIDDIDYSFDKPINTIEDFILQMTEKRVSPSPWRYVIRKSILIENSIYFPVGITIAEDCLWLNNMLGYIKTAVFNSRPFYKYKIHSDSITTTMNFSKIEDHMKVCDELFKLAESRNSSIKNLHFSYCCILSNAMLQHYLNQTKKNRQSIKKWVEENKESFNEALKMYPPIKMISRLIGNFSAMHLFALLVKLKNKL